MQNKDSVELIIMHNGRIHTAISELLMKIMHDVEFSSCSSPLSESQKRCLGIIASSSYIKSRVNIAIDFVFTEISYALRAEEGKLSPEA